MDKHKAWFSVAKSGDEDALKLAIESGSDVNAVDELKNTALHYAASQTHLNAANDRLTTPLHLMYVDDRSK